MNFSDNKQSFNVGFGETQVISGADGATYVPDVSEDGVLSWTNDRNLPNPEPVNIKGKDGKDGKNGQDGYTPVKGKDYYTEADKTEMVNAVLAALPNGDEVSY